MGDTHTHTLCHCSERCFTLFPMHMPEQCDCSNENWCSVEKKNGGNFFFYIKTAVQRVRVCVAFHARLIE